MVSSLSSFINGFVSSLKQIPKHLQRFLNQNFRWIAHFVGLLPLVFLGWDVLTGNNNLTINPIQYLTLRTGKAALVMVVITLSCTPLNSILGFKAALKSRRTFGLYTFFYAFLHVLIFFGLDYLFDFRLIWKDLIEKRYIYAGAGSFIILLPLAITSFQWWMKRMGRNWKRLHRLVYLGAFLAAVHYIWLVKTDIRVPLLYAAGILALLFLRVQWVRKTIVNLRYSLRR
jgi:methionine sulfoxide reductase heme-binding subunit